MMDLNDTPEQAAFRKEARSWLEANAIPAHEAEKFDEAELCRKWFKRKFDGGWSCIGWPKKFGGRGASPIEQVIWTQEEERYPHLSNEINMIGPGMVAPTLMQWLRDEPKTLERLLTKIASGEEFWAQLFSEPAGGSDLAALRTSAVKDGDEWVINGQKIWTSNFGHASWAILVARTDPSVPKHKGLTYFYLRTDSPGIDHRPIRQINYGTEFSEVFLENVRIPDSQRVGEVGDGWKVALSTLLNERIAVNDQDFGANFDNVYDLASKVPLAGKPAIQNDAVRDRLADWYCQEMGLKYGTYRMLSALGRGQMPGPETSMQKMVGASKAQDMAAFAMDLMGQSSIEWNADDRQQDMFTYALFMMAAVRIAGGTDEIQANIIAERVLGLPPEIRVDKGMAFNEVPTGS